MSFTVTLPSGQEWTPQFVQSIDEGERIHVDLDDDDDEEYEKKVMTVAHGELCIGCTACSRICPKKCYTHAPATV
jgi:formate hydrogenlyase subunit 6/NADH:ubiquinone oxidoreductase subunit I